MAKLKKFKTSNKKIYGIFMVPFTYICSLARFSFTEIDNSQDIRWREGTIFYFTLPLPLAHEHSHLFAIFHVGWLSRIFNRTTSIYQRATRWDLPPYRIAIWLIDWLIMQCVSVYMMIWFKVFVIAIWHRKPVDLS